jgi:hypothetical protein
MLSFLHAFTPKHSMYSSSLYSFYIPCQFRLCWFDYSNNMCRCFNLYSSSLCSFLHPLVTSSPLDPSIFLSTLIRHNPQSVIFLACDKPSFTPIQIMGRNYSFARFELLTSLDSRWEDRRFWAECKRVLPKFNLLLISSIYIYIYSCIQPPLYSINFYWLENYCDVYTHC